MLDEASKDNIAQLPDAKLSLDDKVDELTSILRGHEQNLFELGNQASNLNPEGKQVAVKMRQFAFKTGTVITDSHWIDALKRSGLSDDEIVKLLSVKEQVSLEGKDDEIIPIPVSERDNLPVEEEQAA